MKLKLRKWQKLLPKHVKTNKCVASFNYFKFFWCLKRLNQLKFSRFNATNSCRHKYIYLIFKTKSHLFSCKRNITNVNKTIPPAIPPRKNASGMPPYEQQKEIVTLLKNNIIKVPKTFIFKFIYQKVHIFKMNIPEKFFDLNKTWIFLRIFKIKKTLYLFGQPLPWPWCRLRKKSFYFFLLLIRQTRLEELKNWNFIYTYVTYVTASCCNTSPGIFSLHYMN